MGMCIGLGRFAMCGPSRMTDSAGPGQRASVVRLLGEFIELAGRFDDLGEFGTVPDCKSGGVISAVL